MVNYSSTVTDLSLLDFTWKVTSFTEKSMKVQVSFVDPVSVSSGLYRDYFVATIRDPEYFISDESFLRISANSTD